MRNKRNNANQLIVFSNRGEDAGYGIIHTSNTMETEYDISKFSACEKRSDGRKLIAPVFVMNHFYGFYPIPGATTSMGLLQTMYFAVDKSTDLSFTSPNQYRYFVQRAGICFFQECKWPNFIAADNVGSKDGGERQVVLNINKSNGCCCVTQNPSTKDKTNNIDKYNVVDEQVQPTKEEL